MNKHVILGVHITNRLKDAVAVQAALTEFGCSIRTRLGLHEASESVCSPAGLMLLEMVGGEAKADELAAKLKAIPGLEVKKMTFGHA
jgi:hypothetical protein